MRRKLRFFAVPARFAPVQLAFCLLVAPLGLVHGSESWHVTPGAGVLLFSGDQPARDNVAATLRLGYDLDAPLSLELGGLTGSLDSRAEGSHDLYGSWADAIIHLARWERFDPFLSAGAGAFWTDGRVLPDNREEGVVPRLGLGFLYSLSEHWSARVGVTLMTMRVTDRHDCFGLAEAGLSYYFGDTTPARP